MWKFYVKIKPVLRKKNGTIFFVKITLVCQDNSCQDTANTGVFICHLVSFVTLNRVKEYNNKIFEIKKIIHYKNLGY